MTARWRIGVDFGGTKIEIIALAPDGTPALRRRVANPRVYDAAVQTVQNNETAIMRQYLFTLPALKQIAPSTSAALDNAAQQAVAADRDLFQKTQVQVIPIQHTITVTPE